MKKYIILFLFSINIVANCQTETIEKKSISNRYNKGEISIETYRQYANDWQEMINEIGGYPDLPYDSASNSIRFVSVQKTGLSKKRSFDRIMEWAAINFGSLDHVLHYENYENGKIILKGNFNITHKKEYKNFWGNSKERITTTTCYQTYIFTIKENKIKIEIVDVKFKFKYVGYYSSTLYIPNRTIEVSIHDLYPITDFNTDKWKEKLDLLKQTNVRITNLINDLNTYIKDYNADNDF